MRRILLEHGNIMPGTDFSPWAQNDNSNARASVISQLVRRNSSLLFTSPFFTFPFFLLSGMTEGGNADEEFGMGVVGTP